MFTIGFNSSLGKFDVAFHKTTTTSKSSNSGSNGWKIWDGAYAVESSDLYFHSTESPQFWGVDFGVTRIVFDFRVIFYHTQDTLVEFKIGDTINADTECTYYYNDNSNNKDKTSSCGGKKGRFLVLKRYYQQRPLSLWRVMVYGKYFMKRSKYLFIINFFDFIFCGTFIIHLFYSNVLAESILDYTEDDIVMI